MRYISINGDCCYGHSTGSIMYRVSENFDIIDNKKYFEYKAISGRYIILKLNQCQYCAKPYIFMDSLNIDTYQINLHKLI